MANSAPPRRHPREIASNTNRTLADVVGSGITPALSLLLVLVWLGIGLAAGFTDDWFAVLFAVTGATTFVMVFLLEHATRRDLRAALLKLDVLVEALEGADEDAVRAERKSIHEQEELERELPR